MLLHRRTLLSAAVTAPLIPLPALAADLQAALGGLERFIGKWRGEGDGQPGHSTVERSYAADLGGQVPIGVGSGDEEPVE